ncbi:BID domain-containing T4SS effector [Bartonella tribocorum]|uniref:BepD protein n=1 Tax=Bartonella tribocorum TaxID=85701 RepID=A0A2M6URM7_9HYPH|nr:BID domain-containing T4SS effector [Bartonella tribocorum]PIT68840.1 hypothetical protein CEV08_07375 [Bartonella tribocorum]
MKKSHPQPAPQNPKTQNPKTQNPEALYAKVNKPHKRREGPRILSSEEVQAAHRNQPLQSKSFPYDYPRGRRSNVQEHLQEHHYDRPRGKTNDYDTPSKQPTKAIYPPKKPQEDPYNRLGGAPSNGRRATELASPYAIFNLETGEIEFEQQINPLHDSVNGSTQDVQHPQNLDEHIYAELDFGANSGRPPHKPLESVYATVGIGAEGGQEPQQQTNPLYEGVSRRTTPPPRTAKDMVTSKLLQNIDFQYGVREIQIWCQTVYGNEYAMNEKLAQILDKPQDADKVLWDLAANPKNPGKLAGKKVFGIKSPDRKAAEKGLSPLFAALERHIDTTKKLHRQFTRELEKVYKHESPERDPEHKHHHHHHHRHHARGRKPDSPEHSPQRERHGEKGMAHAM